MKICFRCNAEKDLSDFYKHPQMADGHLNKCKECAKDDNRKRGSDPEYERRRNKLPHRLRARKLYDQTEDGKAAHKRAIAAYRGRNPNKYKAHCVLNNAVRGGKLQRGISCEICGSGTTLHAHHDDYSKTLEVRWLCATCHRQWHAKNGEAPNAA